MLNDILDTQPHAQGSRSIVSPERPKGRIRRLVAPALHPPRSHHCGCSSARQRRSSISHSTTPISPCTTPGAFVGQERDPELRGLRRSSAPTSLVSPRAAVSALLPILGPVRGRHRRRPRGEPGLSAGVWSASPSDTDCRCVATAALLLVGRRHSFDDLPPLCNGLETSMVLAGVTWAILLADGDEPSHTLCLLCGALPLPPPAPN